MKEPKWTYFVTEKEFTKRIIDRHKRSKIKSVKGLCFAGQFFDDWGNQFLVTEFPTRYTVCGVNPFARVGEPRYIKVPISQITWIEKWMKENEIE